MDNSRIEEIQKKFPGSVVSMMSDFKTTTTYLSTGSIVLDKMLGNGGLPRGKIVEFIGDEACGKTSLANCLIANAQVAYGDKALYVDAEWAYNKEYARDVYGVNENKMILFQPKNGEDAVDVMCDCVSNGDVQIVVLDSVSSILPSVELDKNADEASKVGIHATFVKGMIQKMMPLCGAKNVLFIVINQWRNTIGYGRVETGGKSLEYWKSVSINLKGEKLLEDPDNEQPVGKIFSFLINKNRYGSPFGKGKITLRWGNEPYGIDNINDVMEIAIQGKVILDNRGWLEYEGDKYRRKALHSIFVNDSDAFDELLIKCFGEKSV